MNIDLTGKKAIVCGASKGIGRAAAIELAQLGASVTVIARRAEALEELVRALPRPGTTQSHNALSADFADPENLETKITAHIADIGPVHILVNNTGGPPAGPVHTAEAGQFIQAFTQHLLGSQIMARAVLPGMRAQQYGRIINIISTSVKQPIPGLGVSNTVRGAVAGWAKTLAGEVAADGITVNNILPGYTETDRLEEILKGKALKQGLSLEDIIAAEKATIPARRFGSPEELAQAVAFLASPAAAYINGINLPVDGGRTSAL